MQRKLPGVSTTQLIASGTATAIAAVGASFLGVYGTIAGAAFMSVVSTACTTIGKHYLDQGREQLKERTHLHTAAGQRHAAGQAAAEAVSADPTRTVAWSHVGGDPNATRLDAGAVASDPNTTRLDGAPEHRVAGELADDAGTQALRQAAGRAALGDTLDWVKRRWPVLLLSSVAVFAVVMGGITIAEKITDKPASGWVGQNRSTGTTWGNVGGGGQKEKPAHTPTVRPTESGTGPATPAPTGSTGGASPRQSQTPSGGTSPSPSVAPSTPVTPPPSSAPVPTAPNKSPDGGQGGVGDQPALRGADGTGTR
ncbi:hypothetical protein [Actinomadura macrotermitis]|uniref:Uncharacterized protein n=1 Tax=Actinomadura macrotermitis TaxID=2585200 RepID=A0A7K0C421_9ACTN|nr:hypothetical protein [Actinomadura macrotermitis]MQY08189.1 hypothetical protein [Actinomadura macrotermitis]